MTREEARKAAEVMLAFANGETIERYEDSIGEWVEVGNSCAFKWDIRDYRVKPKGKFNPRTLKPFDKVLVLGDSNEWICDFYSHTENNIYGHNVYICVGDSGYVIPYNDETKHLVGTSDEVPEYYRYWEE